MAKNQEKKQMRVIRETQVNTPESLLTIEQGATVEVSCVDFAPFSTVKSASTRLNQRAGFTEFEVTTSDNDDNAVLLLFWSSTTRTSVTSSATSHHIASHTQGQYSKRMPFFSPQASIAERERSSPFFAPKCSTR